MTSDDYARLWNAYVDFAVRDGEEHDVTPPRGARFHSRLSGCSAREAKIFAQNYAYEIEHNPEGVAELRRKIADCDEYMLVSTYSTQVVCNIANFGTKAVVVGTPHRNGLVRWAAENKSLVYASDLELLPVQRQNNVLRVVF